MNIFEHIWIIHFENVLECPISHKNESMNVSYKISKRTNHHATNMNACVVSYIIMKVCTTECKYRNVQALTHETFKLASSSLFLSALLINAQNTCFRMHIVMRVHCTAHTHALCLSLSLWIFLLHSLGAESAVLHLYVRGHTHTRTLTHSQTNNNEMHLGAYFSLVSLDVRLKRIDTKGKNWSEKGHTTKHIWKTEMTATSMWYHT